jgi:hypothetical protein
MPRQKEANMNYHLAKRVIFGLMQEHTEQVSFNFEYFIEIKEKFHLFGCFFSVCGEEDRNLTKGCKFTFFQKTALNFKHL